MTRVRRGRKWGALAASSVAILAVLAWLSGGAGTLSGAPQEGDSGPPGVATANAAETVRLERPGKRDIPLHPADRARQVSARVPSGTLVTVVQRAAESGWVEVAVPNGAKGWVSPRYVAGTPGGSPPPKARELRADSPWHSRAACERLVQSGARKPLASGHVRLGTWNVRWFPDGMLGRGHHGEKPTDIPWLACAVAWMRVDVLAVQEFRRSDLGKSQVALLLTQLDTLTGGKWQAQFDSCAGAARQHVGLLYDSKRAHASNWYTLASLNPNEADACAGNLRPGFGAYLRFPSGLDLHLIDVHLKSGPTKRSYELRRRSIAGIREAYAELQRVAPDSDLVVVGDWNSMGCEDCGPGANTSPSLEATLMDTELSTLVPAFRRLPASEKCSEYYDGAGGLLDHYVASVSAQELGTAARAEVEGYCKEVGCAGLSAKGMPEAYRALSDHCPVLLDILDKDLDP